jgi:multidrug efflux pump subunit AcrA (membrane-fusion protein)
VFLLLTPWQQTVSGAGQVVAYAPVDREIELESPITGRIVRWFVLEGQNVEAGDPIVELQDVNPDYVSQLKQKRAAAERRVDAAGEEATAYAHQREALLSARGLALEAAALKVQMAELKLAAARQTSKAEEVSLHTAEENQRRLRQLFDEGIVSERDLEVSQLAYAKSLATLNKARAAVSEAQALVTSLKAERFQKGAEADAKIASATASKQKSEAKRAYAESEIAKIEVEIGRQASSLVRAPRAGTILNVVGSEGGKVVKTGAHLARLVPDTGSPAVELWVDGNDAPLITEGRAVRLQFEGWPAVQFSGWPSVAVGTFSGEVLVVNALARANGRFRVLVGPTDEEEWPSRNHLRQGVKAKGWVLLDQVRMGYELWRRLNGFPVGLENSPITPKQAKSK